MDKELQRDKDTKNFIDTNGICGVGRGREPQRHKEHEGLEVKNYLCDRTDEEEIKKMDYRSVSTEQIYNPSFDFFFNTSGYLRLTYYCNAFVLFVSLWFSSSLIFLTLCIFVALSPYSCRSLDCQQRLSSSILGISGNLGSEKR